MPKERPRKWLVPRYRIRNNLTGAYIHDTPTQPMTFLDRAEAWRYIKQHGLNPEIYFVEVVR